jgi:hypothetical protein
MYLVHSLALTGAVCSAGATIFTRLGLHGHDAYTAAIFLLSDDLPSLLMV